MNAKGFLVISALLPGIQLDAQAKVVVVPLVESDGAWVAAQKALGSGEQDLPKSCLTKSVKIDGRIDGSALSQLFPGWQFVGYTSTLGMKPNCPDASTYSIPGPMQFTLAIPPESSSLAWDARKSGFDALLLANSIGIQNLETARLVWNAYCEYARNSCEGYESKRFSRSEWRLGYSSYDQTVAADERFRTIVRNTHYAQVQVDPKTGRIVSFKTKVEQSEKRREEIGGSQARPN